MKKSITINVVLIMLSVVVAYACLLLMPFFWKWYESVLGSSAEGVKLSFNTISLVCFALNVLLNGISIIEKT